MERDKVSLLNLASVTVPTGRCARENSETGQIRTTIDSLNLDFGFDHLDLEPSLNSEF